MTKTYIDIKYFQDSYLLENLQAKLKTGKCEIGEEESEECIEVSDLTSLFEPLLGLYIPYDRYSASSLFEGGSHEDEGPHVSELIQEDFGVFDDYYHSDNYRMITDIIIGAFPNIEKNWQLKSLSEDPCYRFDNCFIHDEDSQMEYDFWESFKEELKHSNRFFPDNQIQLDNLDKIFQTRKRTVSIDTVFYRARPSDKVLNKNEMGPPPCKFASVGRANPKGISYFYLGSNTSICEKEIKIKTGETYSIGEFSLKEPKVVVDLSNYYITSPFALGPELKSYIQDLEILKMYIQEMSSKTNSHDPYFDYLPTQYISERIKHNKYDGLMFKSSLGDGVNYVFFNEDDFTCIKVEQKVSS
ncbi:RES domain protein [Bacteriovorax sp. BAL6_X]|uniref:RES domain-containing protein n=1 Tax=Bacteriovorax sp. BAL6_X TaxID=1201290 RepID=UPI000386EAA5|nr:RES domain-containing protein [Bacteriovorax sp. BAL6_X]EPZ51736.1 RES domain protein [Bacteriovorax sp. BAL6_X]